MKDINIENILETEYKESMSDVKFPDKRKLYALYGQKRRARVPKRVVAAIAAAAVLVVVTVTAAASGVDLWRGDRWNDIRAIIAAKFAGENIPDYQLDNLADRLDNIAFDTQDFASDMYLEINDYEETIGVLYGVADLQKVLSYDGETQGYIYRYDHGMFPNWRNMLLPEEYDQIYNDGTLAKMFAMGVGEKYSRNWVYVFDRNGMEILGKLKIGDIKFRTNEELEDTNISKLFYDGVAVPAYDELVRDRIDYKKEYGRAPEIKKDYTPPDLPTEGFNLFFPGGDFPIVLSDDAVAVASDPEMVDIDEIVCVNTKTDHPGMSFRMWVHKTGTCIITVTDGEDEYKFEFTCKIGRNYYVNTIIRIE